MRISDWSSDVCSSDLNWVVQLGAYENAAVASDGWNRIRRVLPVFQGQTPQGMHFSGNGGEFYHLSVGGFARSDAVSLCRRYKAKGSHCFVRQDAGDQVTKWVSKRTMIASLETRRNHAEEHKSELK